MRDARRLAVVVGLLVALVVYVAQRDGAAAATTCRSELADERALVDQTAPDNADGATQQPASLKARASRSKRQRTARRRARARKSATRQKSTQTSATAVASTVPRAVDNTGEPIEGTATMTFPFGAERSPMVRHQPVAIPDEMPLSSVRVTAPFGDITTTDGEVLPYQQVAAAITRRGPGQLMTVAVCINPTTPTEVEPGSYTGAILVGAGTDQTPVTIQATVQDDRNVLVALFALGGVLAGLCFKVLADLRTWGLPDTVSENLRSPRTLVALGAGLVTAVYSYLTIYADDPTFSADLTNLWRLAAEAFAGTLAAKAITDLAKPPAPVRGDTQTVPATSTPPANATAPSSR